MPAKAKTDLSVVHARLKAIMGKYARGSLQPRRDTATEFELAGPPTEASRGKEVWFGAVQIRFTAPDENLFKELAGLTDKGHKAFRKARLVT